MRLHTSIRCSVFAFVYPSACPTSLPNCRQLWSVAVDLFNTAVTSHQMPFSSQNAMKPFGNRSPFCQIQSRLQEMNVSEKGKRGENDEGTEKRKMDTPNFWVTAALLGHVSVFSCCRCVMLLANSFWEVDAFVDHFNKQITKSVHPAQWRADLSMRDCIHSAVLAMRNVADCLPDVCTVTKLENRTNILNHIKV